MKENRTAWKAIHAVDSSRRVGWAKYFQSEEKINELRQDIDELVSLILHNNRIPSNDELISRARHIQRKAWRD